MTCVRAVWSKYASAVALASCFFSFVKARSCSSVHVKELFLCVIRRRGSAVVERSGRNRALNPTIPRKLRSSAAVLGRGASMIA